MATNAPAGAAGTTNTTPAARAGKPVTVTALGPVRHGVKEGGEMVFRDYAEGESFEVADQKTAHALRDSGAVRLGGNPSTVDQAAQQDQPADADKIDKGNAKADADRGKTAAKEAGQT